MTAHALQFSSIEAYSTPRRLAVYVTGIPESQADTQEEVKGPAKKIAIDADGNWSKAAQGFVRGQGLTTDAITFKRIKWCGVCSMSPSIFKVNQRLKF